MQKNYDVIVIGGGTAGSAAAITSAMAGARTLIVERNTYLGGTGTGGQVAPMMHTGIDGEAGTSFLNELVKKKMMEAGSAANDSFGNSGWLNPEMLKFTLEELYTEHGGDILYLTQLIDTVVEGNEIKAILVQNKAGLTLLTAKIFIDCTGDADAAYLAGATCFQGDEQHHKNQAMSLRFMLGNVDVQMMKAFLKQIGEMDILEYPLAELCSTWESDTPLRKLFQKGLENQEILQEDGVYVQAFSVPGMPGVMSFNCPEIAGIDDMLDPAEISKGLVVGRQMIKRLHRFLQKNVPGFSESFVLSVADLPGIRESRRIKGLYVITEEDYQRRASFPDAIAKTAYPIDVHGGADEVQADETPMERGAYVEIPYRCLVPEKLENLLVAGRCLSATFIAQSALRIQATCRAMGEAAGAAAAYCVKNNQKVHTLDGKLVKTLLHKPEMSSSAEDADA